MSAPSTLVLNKNGFTGGGQPSFNSINGEVQIDGSGNSIYALSTDGLPQGDGLTVSFSVLHKSGSAVYRIREGGSSLDVLGTLVCFVSASAPGIASSSGTLLTTGLSEVTLLKVTGESSSGVAVVNGYDITIYGGEVHNIDTSVPFPRYRPNHFLRGMRFGNIGPFPGEDPSDLVHGGPRIYHGNSVQVILPDAADKFVGDMNGVVRFRFVDHKKSRVPLSVRHYDRFVSSYGNPIFPWVSGSG